MGCCVSKSLDYPILGKPYEDIESHYSLGRILGWGQFGVSYLCTENSANGQFACESIAKKPKVRHAEKDMIRRDIQIRQHLSGHPNIVEFKSAYEDETAVHVVTELCEGGDLFDRIIAKGYYSERDAAPVLRAIVNAVYDCHSMGVMHRDLKPENFYFINGDDNAPLKVTNFGSALLFKEGTVYRDIVGSGFYIAPEVLQRRYGKEIDIWSAGVILYILLSGVPPFWPATKKDAYTAILQGEIDFETYPWPSISSTAKDLVRRMLTKDPKRRITAAQVLEDPWLRESGEASDDTSLILRMKQFRRMNKLKKLTIKVIVEYLPDEDTQALKEKFTEMDTDKNGTLSYGELKAGLTKLGSMLTEFDVRQLMEAADIDGNGAIDSIEFIAATIQRHKLERPEYLSKAFQYFDEDDSGYITLDELDTAFKKNNMGDANIEELLFDVDSNKDGMISYDEFCAMVERPQSIRNVSHIYTEKAKKIGLRNTKQFRAMNVLRKLFLKVIVKNLPTEEEQKLKEKFREMDNNNNGTLTLSELKAGLAKLGSALEESEVSQYMEAGDLDGNGNIDFIEFVNLMTDIYKLETPELLEKAFQHLDKNSDRFITVSELETAFKENKMGDDATIKEIMSEVGRDHKGGKISFDQFCAMMKGGSQLRAPTLGNLSYMMKGKGQKFRIG